MPRRRKVYGDCAYCGQYDKLTRDHVIPQNFFPEDQPLPGDLPKVYACVECNNEKKSANDAYLRDLLVTDMYSSHSPIAQQLLPKFGRAIVRNQSKLARDILQNRQLVELRTPGGLFAGKGYTSEVANDKTLEIMAMYVRGLYSYYFHKILPQNMEFDLFRVDKSDKLNDVLGMLNEKGGSYARIGTGDVFECVFGHAADVPEVGIWILNFLRRALFVVVATPMNLM